MQQDDVRARDARAALAAEAARAGLVQEVDGGQPARGLPAQARQLQLGAAPLARARLQDHVAVQPRLHQPHRLALPHQQPAEPEPGRARVHAVEHEPPEQRGHVGEHVAVRVAALVVQLPPAVPGLALAGAPGAAAHARRATRRGPAAQAQPAQAAGRRGRRRRKGLKLV